MTWRRLGAKVLQRWAVIPLLAIAWAGAAVGDTTSVRFPTSCISTPTTIGALAWSAPSNAQADEPNVVTQTGSLNDPLTPSSYLECTGFGFSVPAGATISGVTMQLDRKANNANPPIADAHVYPALSDGSIGTAATDRARGCGTGNDWPTTNQPAVTYDGGADPTWGVTWGACDPAMSLCSDPAGSFNVNHASFGAAVAAKVCSALSNRAQVDFMTLQVAYTVAACGGAAWGPIVVSPASAVPGATTDYTITATLPATAGCALRAGTEITVTFPADTDVDGVLLGNLKAPGGPASGVTFPTSVHANHVVTFLVPSAGLPSCEGQCIPAGATVVIFLSGVKNPTVESESHTLTLSATSTLSGATGSTASSPYAIENPCVSSGPSASTWGPVTVALADAQQSFAGCPKVTRYTIATTTPAPLGCKLLADQSQLVVTLPATPSGSDVSKVSNATVQVGAGPVTPVALDLTGAPLVAKLTPPIDVPNAQPLTITLDLVQNPSATSPAPTLRLQALGARDGDSAEATSAPYAITAGSTCTPALDFFVRDWTTNASTHDVGNSPSNGPNWAATSDVWNQYAETPPVVVNDWVVGVNPAVTGSDFAYARISLKAPGAAPAFGRVVTVRFYVAPFGGSPMFGLLNQTTIPLDWNASPTFVDVPWPSAAGTLTGAVAGTHLCLAVEIVSPSDPLTSPTLLNTTPDATSKNFVEADNNQAQRNLTLIAVPTPAPAPAPPGGGAGAGGMQHFAMAHNGTSETRDLTYRVEVDPRMLERLADARVTVVGGRSEPLKPRGEVTLPRMRPAEDRWIAISYTLTPGEVGTLLPVELSEMDGETRVSGFTFGIRPSPLPDAIAENLRLHRHVFARLAAAFGVSEGRAASQAAGRLLDGKPVSPAQYLRFLADQRRAIAAATTRFVESRYTKDTVGLRASLRNFEEQGRSRYAKVAATAHLALLEKLDAVQNMREMARGNPYDVPQIVRWQEALFGTVPALRDLPAAKDVVKRSQAFLDAYRGDPSDAKRYRALLADSMRSFQAAAGPLRKSGVETDPSLARLQKRLRTGHIAALERAHRRYLLRIDDLAAAATVAVGSLEPRAAGGSSRL